jgi:hypothetical protein
MLMCEKGISEAISKNHGKYHEAYPGYYYPDYHSGDMGCRMAKFRLEYIDDYLIEIGLTRDDSDISEHKCADRNPCLFYCMEMSKYRYEALEFWSGMRARFLH